MLVAVLQWRLLINSQVGPAVPLIWPLVNVIMLTGYTLGCHAFRHVIGGGSNDWTSSGMARLKYKMWKFSTKLNEKHKDWALYSLFWVMFTDFYIYACTDPMFGWTDYVLWGGL